MNINTAIGNFSNLAIQVKADCEMHLSNLQTEIDDKEKQVGHWKGQVNSNSRRKMIFLTQAATYGVVAVVCAVAFKALLTAAFIGTISLICAKFAFSFFAAAKNAESIRSFNAEQKKDAMDDRDDWSRILNNLTANNVLNPEGFNAHTIDQMDRLIDIEAKEAGEDESDKADIRMDAELAKAQGKYVDTRKLLRNVAVLYVTREIQAGRITKMPQATKLLNPLFEKTVAGKEFAEVETIKAEQAGIIRDLTTFLDVTPSERNVNFFSKANIKG